MLNIAHRATEKEFAHFELFYRDSKQKVQADRVNILGFLQDRGYYLYRTSVNKHIFIRIIDNIVKEVGKKDLVDEVLENIRVNESRNVYEAFLNNVTKFFNDDFLRSLPAKQVEFRKDRSDAIQIYYQNCIVKITKTKITTHSYTELNGYIWESQILLRDYKEVEISEDADFTKFIFNLADKNNERATSICTAFGFYLHNFKQPGFCPAIILNDEVISEHPEGGTGKGLFFKAVSKFIKMLTIDGKVFNFDKNFIYQRVTKDTRLVFFDDVKKNFDFERLFSAITEGMVTEKKGKDEEYIDYADSPKIGVSTNYAIRGSGNSHTRRRHEIEISQHYNKYNNPKKEFGRLLFDEWPETEWWQFDNYMIQCCQLYLNQGLVEQKLINLDEKRILAETSQDFVEFIKSKDLLAIGLIAKKDLLNEFLEDNDDIAKQKWFTKNLFTKWIETYCEHNSIKVLDRRDPSGSFRCYQFSRF